MIIMLSHGNLIFASEPENVFFSILTKDSIFIESTPYCHLGSLGETTVTELKTNTLLYKINRCLPYETFFSADGYRRVEVTSFGVNVYYKNFFIKQCSKSELIDVNNPKTVRFPNGIWYSCDGIGWIIDCFIMKDIFYMLKCDGVLAKIDLNKPKNEPPILHPSMTFEEYNQLKAQAEPRIISHHKGFEYPYAEDHIFSRTNESIETEIQSLAETLTVSTLNLSIVVLFEDCQPKLLSYVETESYFYFTPFIHDSQEDYLFHYVDSELLYPIKHFVEEKKNWKCKIPKPIGKWAFSYLIRVNP
ncbi:MAG: hypothetical protein AB8B69_11170 [Chitinophagales bacterium]